MGTVVGLFDNTTQAQTAVQQLRNSGINVNDIGVAMRSVDTTGTTAVVDTDTGTSGAATGAVTGGALGGLAGLLVGVGALTIPGVGPIVAAGPLGTALATTLVGAGIGAATGGIIGALVDAGVPEEEARLYNTGVERGGVLVTVRVPDGQEQNALNILNANGARDIRNDSGYYSDPNWRYGDTKYGGGKDEGIGTEAAAGLGGAAAGAAIGTAVAGPLGTGIGAVIGGAAGAGAGAMAENDETAGDTAGDTAGAVGGGAAGAATGAAIGAIGGPVGMGVGAAIGGAAGAAAGKGATDAAQDVADDTVNTDTDDTAYRDTYNRP